MANLKPATKMAAVCMGIIAIAAIFCFCLSQHYKINHPVLCKVYGAYPIDMKNEDRNSDIFQIPYLACKAGERQIEELRFDGTPGLFLYNHGEESNGSSQDTEFYMRKELAVSAIMEDESHPKFTEPVTLTTAVVTYQDKSKERIDIGKIILYPQIEEESQPLSSYGCESYADDSCNSQIKINVQATKDFQLKSIEPIPGSKTYKVKVNNKSIEEAKKIKWKKDQQINIAFEQKSNLFTLYEPIMKTTSVTKDGKEHVQYLGPFQQETFDDLTFFETVSYLKERGVL